MDEPWKSPHRPVSDPLTLEQRKITNDFESIAERDAWMIANAEYFTVGRRLGPREGYERHEVHTLDDAEKLAANLAKKANRIYMIYAIVGPHDCFVKSIHPNS